jgi:hypothetical protein
MGSLAGAAEVAHSVRVVGARASSVEASSVDDGPPVMAAAVSAAKGSRAWPTAWLSASALAPWS